MTFKKGQSGNPNGRPRSGTTIADLLQETMSKEDFAKEIIKRIKGGDSKLMRYVWDRLEGKMKDNVDLTVNSFVEWMQQMDKDIEK